jgi:alkylation response protein AidB-like acyl-CoA dehydrogenase
MSREDPDFLVPLREFLEKESPPERVREIDERHEAPLDLLRRLGELGYLSIGLPEEHDGHGDAYDIVRFMEELGYHNLPLGHLVGRSMYAMQLLLDWGTQAQQERWIRPLRLGEIVFTVGMTEPDAGSDLAALRTRAVADGDHYVINGEKTFSSSMGYAGLAMVATRTNPEAKKRQGLTVFLVDPASPGIECHRLDTLGDWGVGTYQVVYTDVRVHRDGILGRLDAGWEVVTSHLVRERAVMAARAVGATRRLLDITTRYLCEREQFGHPLADFQVLQHKLADIAIELQLARAGLYALAERMAEGSAAPVDAAVVKTFASEMYVRAANHSMQMSGGFGYTREFEAQRHLRDSRIYVVGGGSSEVMRNIIARELLREPRARAGLAHSH